MQPNKFFIKRLFDICVSTIVLLLLSPFVLIVVLTIHLESSGSAFFSQARVGKDGQVFNMWKFRSMYIDAEKHKTKLSNDMAGGILFKMKKDPRITYMGKFIRKASIDEIPQFWNVLKGDMSLVGPRPALPHEVKQYNEYQRQRLDVQPGITCIWQVSGRSELSFQQQVEMDLEYIAKQSFCLDIILLLKTIPAVLTGRGAY
ncbi:exopolysaccharide biosynthesis polyprenyl glycosylphosphotransferase [Candidatus Halobeggiatoa sp. HSG11]|nr:exopolysaccharide biosynthesis polyprenyl glycosylphosphotransferase [Candidatus Halobeggiatoa sp. HSG11]